MINISVPRKDSLILNMIEQMTDQLNDSEVVALARIVGRRLLEHPNARDVLAEPGNKNIRAMIKAAMGDESLRNDVWRDIEDGIAMFNRFLAGENIFSGQPLDLNYAEDMRGVMTELGIGEMPTLGQLLQTARGERPLRLTINLMKAATRTAGYGFIRTYEEDRAVRGEAVAIYGKLLIEMYPELKTRGVYGASTLEEMWAVMAINGDRRRSFEAVADWYADEMEGNPGVKKGFSGSLVAKVERIRKGDKV